MLKTEKTKPDPSARRFCDGLIQARKEKERLQFEKQRPIVCDNTELYVTCLTFLASAVERKDEERARFWSRKAFRYAPLPERHYEEFGARMYPGTWNKPIK